MSTKDPRVALVHYWLTTWGGGEKVLRELVSMYPQADVYAVVASEEIVRRLGTDRVKTSFLQHLPGSRRWHRHYLPLYPIAVEQFDLRNYDLVISSHSGPAHGVLTTTDTCHICYCHSPMRYLWDLYHEYTSGDEMGASAKLLFRPVAHYMRLWDAVAAARVDHFVANSFNVARRIEKTYRRDATVIYPPVETDGDAAHAADGEDHYLVVGRLISYKRFDLAIEACAKLGRRLRVVGSGPQLRSLRARDSRSPVDFITDASDEQLAKEYACCRALLFPGEDDFGMVPVEAQSHGRPVIAYKRGGAVESVAGVDVGEPVPPGATGVFFREQTVESLVSAMRYFEVNEFRFDRTAVRNNAQRFSPSAFRRSMSDFVNRCLDEHDHRGRLLTSNSDSFAVRA